jgi:hypothetical protein
MTVEKTPSDSKGALKVAPLASDNWIDFKNAQEEVATQPAPSTPVTTTTATAATTSKKRAPKKVESPLLKVLRSKSKSITTGRLATRRKTSKSGDGTVLDDDLLKDHERQGFFGVEEVMEDNNNEDDQTMVEETATTTAE